LDFLHVEFDDTVVAIDCLFSCVFLLPVFSHLTITMCKVVQISNNTVVIQTKTLVNGIFTYGHGEQGLDIYCVWLDSVNIELKK
jgi:hypothetical protein